MFERFTQQARQVVVYAQEEARSLRHNYIGTEHLLLGLLREPEGIAASVLASMEVTPERVRAEITRIVEPSEEATSGQIPFTPRAKKVLELALREALSFGHNHIDTEHLLLALNRDLDGVGIRVLTELGVKPELVRRRTIELMGRSRVTTRGVEVSELDDGWLEGLSDALLELEPELDHRPDSGDLLLALATAGETRAAAALTALGVDLDRLQAAVSEVRAAAPPTPVQRTAEIERVRSEREQAAAEQEYERAAQLRDRERELLAELDLTARGPKLIERLRARLL